MAAAYWGFGLMAAHLGVALEHTSWHGRRLIKEKSHSAAASLRRFCRTGIATMKLTVFDKRDLLIYMFLRTGFVFHRLR